MKLCRYREGYDEEEYGEYVPVMMPWDYLSDFIRKIRIKLYLKLDKDTKHAFICKLVHRHRRSETSIMAEHERDKKDYAEYVKSLPKENTGLYPYLPHRLTFVSSIGNSWNCVRCEEKCGVNMMINTDPEFYSWWRDYCKLTDIPKI